MTATTVPTSTDIVQVGVGVLIMRNHKVLVGKRIGSHGADTWQLAGGHLEFGETFEQCALRESLEETGLTLDSASVKFVTANNNIMVPVHKHYVTVFMSVNAPGQDDPKVMEPTKCERWEWVQLDHLLDENGPYRPLFSPLAKLIKEHELNGLFSQ